MTSSNLPKYEEVFSRNRGIIRNQQVLKDATIAIAGAGGGGGETIVSLARMGVCHIRIAEPDLFDYSNMNRQYGAGMKKFGMNKAAVIADIVKDVNPFCVVEVIEDGINSGNIHDFIKGADIVLEEIDYRSAIYTTILHRAARDLGIPVMTAVPVAWGAYLFFFNSESMTFEEYIAKSPEDSIQEFDDYSYPLYSYCPEPPLYLGKKVISDVVDEIIDIPTVAPAVNLTAGILASFVYFYLSGEKQIKSVPYYYSTSDMFNIKPKKVSFLKKLFFKLIT